jgi:serine/threonine protein kinase/WD40 repeat protein/tetratricopeptide (TPR) repeat protein
LDSPEEHATRDPLERLAEAFLERFRKGERPSLTEYTTAHPELADDIRDLFPALVEIERIQTTGGVGLASSARARPTLSRLGDYQILGRIGEGGMGIVYEAMRESLRSRVALKVMHPRYRDRDNYLRRFHVEARAAARLHHTNIVSVFDYGEADGVVYYAMPFIAGHSLEVVLEEVRRLRGEGGETELAVTRQARAVATGLVSGRFAVTEVMAVDQATGCAPPPTSPDQGGEPEDSPHLDQGGLGEGRTSILSPADERVPGTSKDFVSTPSSLAEKSDTRYHREVARLGAQVADALAYAHKRGILHRDIKPSNLLLDAMGNIWITDFGLAKFEEGDDLSQSHDVLGTLRYMAPERFRGVSDRRCDLYALGATLYEMLTLRPVFEAPDQARLIQRIMNESPIPPRRRDRNLPRDLETIVLKALAKEPRDRFASADELADELRRFAENRPIRSRTTPTYEKAWRWCRRNPGFATLTAAVAVLIVALGLGGTIAAYVYRAQRDNTERHLGRAVRAERRANVALGESLLAEGAALQRTGLVGQRFESVDRLARAARILDADPVSRKRLHEIRNHAIAALALVDLRETWQHPIALSHGIRIDRPAQRYVSFEPPEVVIHNLTDDRVLGRLAAFGLDEMWYGWPMFSPDGNWLAVCFGVRGGGYRLRIWHLTGQEPPRDLPASTSDLAFDPDGRLLVYGPPDGGLAVWDLAACRCVRTFPLDFVPHVICTDPAGARLAVNNDIAAAPRLRVLDFETGRVLADPRSDIGVGAIAWSADGRLLAVGGHNEDPRVYVREISTGKLVSVLRGHTAEIIGAHFAHAGYLLATTSWDDTTRLWDAVSGEMLVTAPGMAMWGFTPDDRGLVLGGRLSMELRELAGGDECRTLHPGLFGNRSEARDMAGIQGADISPDGRLLATSGGAGVRIWDLGTGRELGRLEAGQCPTVLFQPDGSSLVTRGYQGVHRWPIECGSGRDAGTIHIGPPVLLLEPDRRESCFSAAWLPDGRTLALPVNPRKQVLLLDAARPDAIRSRPRILESGHSRMVNVAVSPDGRYLAIGIWRMDAIRVLDLFTHKTVALLSPIPGSFDVTCHVRFSPDGRWLVANTGSYVAEDGYRVWKVGTWKLARRIDEERHGSGGDRPVFTRDGQIMALAIAPDQIQLADAATGRELARLTTLRAVTPVPLAFSPDGTKLAASTREKTVLVWDLRRIRSQLARRNLDWDEAGRWREPAVSPAVRISEALSVKVAGEALEPSAWRAAERVETDRQLARDPEDPGAIALRGWIALKDGKIPEAIADLEHRLRLGPDPDALFSLAEAYERANRPADAVKSFSRLLEEMPGDHDLRVHRAQAAADAGQYALAIDDDTRLLAAHNLHGDVLYRRSWCLYQLGRYQEALHDLDTLVARDADNGTLYDLRAFTRAALGDDRGARADREKAATTTPRDALGLNNRAWGIVKAPSCSKEDTERALAFARRAVALEPDNPFYLNTLGTALYRAGQSGEAVNVLERSLTLHTDLPPAFDLLLLAMAHHRLAQRTEARACFDRALRWHREHPDLQPTWSAELEAFEAEARTLIRPEALPDLPENVFVPYDRSGPFRHTHD